MKRIGLIVALIVFIIAVFLTACSSSQPNQQDAVQPASQTQASSSSSSLDGKALMEERCSKCHGLRQVTSQKKTADEWKGVVQIMVNKGAQLNSEEQSAVIKYLSENYNK